jgi:hypothetical protein
MHLVIISDCHGHYRSLSLPPGDVLIDAGDWTEEDTFDTIRDYLVWLEAQPHPHKVIIPGNHQTLVEANLPWFLETLAEFAPSVDYLNDSGIEIDGVRFWGSGYSPAFCDWAFNVDRGPAIQRHWDMIPTDTQVLITHGPPLGILDVTTYGSGGHYGCGNLATTIRERLKSLKLSAFGHFHGPGGKTEIHDGVTYVNASVVNERYELTNAPIEIDI